MGVGIRIAGIVCGLALLAGAEAGTAATKKPNAPATICVNNKCASGPAATSGKVKWNPGHYGASAGIAYPADTLSKFRPEMDDMLKDDWIVGYRLFMTWAALDAGPITFTGSVAGATSGTVTAAPGDDTYWVAFPDGEYRSVKVTGTAASWSGALNAGADNTAHLYRTSLLDQVLSRLKTNYNKPKQLVIGLLVMSFQHGSRDPDDFGIVPEYITKDVSKYGPSPDGSSSGWWGPPAGATQGAYTAAVYRPNVAAEYGKLGKALGAKYNSDPNFEALMDQETSAVMGPALVFPPKDGSYSDDSYVSSIKTYLTAWRSAFPNTSLILQNTWLNTANPTQQLEDWMIRGGQYIAPSSADSSGQSYYTKTGGAGSWGLSAYAGITVANSLWTGSDSRGMARAMMDVESGNIGTGSGAKQNNTPLDIIAGLNTTSKASHAFWCHVPGSGSPRPTWAQVTAVLRTNPLTNTSYPGNYPQ
ncbi:MAG TPA: hypothetical protein VJQ47_19470 [Steroidobacteraceae bacterium]|nr:hypothetical protein [Steroidobacteraceae bacterium]